MFLPLQPGAELPLYRQLMRQVVEAIASGRLTAGDRLPSHRELSEQLVVAPLTVKKAYDELEAQGFLESAQGRGTFVSAAAPSTRRRSAQRAQEAAWADLVDGFVAQALASGMPPQLVRDQVARALHELLSEAPTIRKR